MEVQTRRRARTLIVTTGHPTRAMPWLRVDVRLLGLTAVLLLSSAAVLPLLPRMINPYDEGMVAFGAERVLHGHQPAVDFYSPYGPGVFYLIAAAYRLFGTRLIVERWVTGALMVATGVLSYLLLIGRELAAGDRRQSAVEGPGARDIGPRPRVPTAETPCSSSSVLVSAITGVIVVWMLACGWWYTPVNAGTLALMLLSGLLLQRGLRSGSGLWAAAAGAAVGLALLWRLVFGAALLLASLLTWGLLAGDHHGSDRRRRRGADLIAMVLAALLIAVPVYVELLTVGGQRAFQSLFVWPFTSTGSADLPWPPFSIRPPRDDLSLSGRWAAATYGASFYYPVAALLLLLWRLPLRLSLSDRRLCLWLLLMLPPLFVYAHGRTDYLHITPLLTFSLLVAAVTAAPAELQGGKGRAGQLFPRALWQAVIVGLWSLSMLALMPTVWYSARHLWESPGRAPLELPGPRGAGVYPPYRYSRQYRRLLPLIHDRVAPAQSIYSGTVRHDIYLTNDILLYFLAERDAATYYWCLDAGVTSSAPVQQQMVAELARGGVAAAVVWTAPRQAEKNAGGRSSGVRLLDDWLAREFRLQLVPGTMYDLRVRNSLWREE